MRNSLILPNGTVTSPPRLVGVVPGIHQTPVSTNDQSGAQISSESNPSKTSFNRLESESTPSLSLQGNAHFFTRFLDRSRRVAEDLLVRIGTVVMPSVFNPPSILTPEIIEILLRDSMEKAQLTEEENLPELTEDDYELLADVEEPWRPHIELPNFKVIYSARDVVNFLKSPIVTWLDRYRLAVPNEIERDEEDSSLLIFAERGIKFEQEYWARWKTEMDSGKDSRKYAAIPDNDDLRRDDYHADCDRRFKATLEAMRDGVDVIYQGFLRSDDGRFEGATDFLVKIKNKPGEKSSFGDYHYEVWDVKLSKEPKTEHVIQISFYTDLLTEIQGLRPENMRLVPGVETNRRGEYAGRGTLVTYKTDSFSDYYRTLKEMFLKYQDAFEPDLDALPEIPKMKEYGRWSGFVKKIIKKRDALSQVAGISNLHILRLRDAGIWTMSQLAEDTREKIERIPDETFARLKNQARLQVESRGRLALMNLTDANLKALKRARIHYIRDLAESTDSSIEGLNPDEFTLLKKRAQDAVSGLNLQRPKFEVHPVDEANSGRGLQALPPASKNDVFFDIEGYMHEDANLEYLLGNTWIDYSQNPKGEVKFRDFWAHTWDEEKRSFEELIDWFMTRWKEDPAMHIFHYASYEITAIKRLAAKYATREKEVDELLRHDVFVDLLKVVKQGMTVGAESYSLKKIEKIYMDHREAEVVSALGSVEAYRDWLESPDGKTWTESKKLSDIRHYNKEDCESTLMLAQFLWELQKKHRISWVDPKEIRRKKQEEKDEAKRLRDEAEKSARQIANEKFRERVSKAKEKAVKMLANTVTPEKRRILELLTHVVDFYWRESKPVLWAKQHRHEMTQDQLVEDPATLGQLTRIIGAPYQPVIGGKSTVTTASSISYSRNGAIPSGELWLDESVEPFKPTERSTSRIFTYRFDPNLGTSLEAGEHVFSDVAHVFQNPDEAQQGMFSEGAETEKENPQYKCEVISIDRQNGVVQIKIGPKALKAAANGVPQTIQLTPRRSKSLIYTYHYDPAQDTKLTAGDSCFFAHDLNIRCKIESIDDKNGLVSIRVGPKALQSLENGPPETLGLIPDEFVSPRTIEESILRTLEKLVDEEQMVDGKRHFPKNIVNFLRKERPRIKGNAEGALIPDAIWDDKNLKDPLQEGIFQAIKNLEASTLCIQGPPGTGKTYRAAKAIVRLIKDAREQGKPTPKIGITALSHNTILNLMEMIQRVANEMDVEISGIKVGDDPYNPFLEEENMEYYGTAKEAALNLDDVDIVGGTAWTFSHEDMEGKFDYLFIEEASQVSLANVVGMAPSARNLVLIGDQMQLPQPVQGAHPGESGMSALDYYLKGSKAIESDKGVLLYQSFRNHPAIVDLYSGPVYDGQVVAAAANARQKLALPNGGSEDLLINKEFGFTYVPVTHHGNRHKSEEEASAVVDIVNELVGREYTNWDNSTRPLNLDDIMIISPYALQVKKIREKLGEEANVGTVHKFQGREAPVAIVSFATSSSSPYSRSMDHWANIRMLNTAISRARGLVIIVGSPELEGIRVRTIEQAKMLNFYYKILRAAGWQGVTPDYTYMDGVAEDE